MVPKPKSEQLDAANPLNDAIPLKDGSIKEILYDGYFYDVTTFMRKHPGGSIIDYYTKPGEDATLAIQQFHQKSSAKVNMIMSALKKRPARDEECMLLHKCFNRIF